VIQSEDPKQRRSINPPELLVLTGPSHAGKTAVSREMLARTPGPAAYLSVDDTLRHTLRRSTGEIWAEIPLAYELIDKELGVLLAKGWFVIVESTFTYVRPDGSGELHDDALARMIGIAESESAGWNVVQLMAGREEIISRAGQTGRLDSKIISEIFDLHQGSTLPSSTSVVDTEGLTPAETAAAISALLDA